MNKRIRTDIPNSVLQNEKLSLRERGLLVYILSLNTETINKSSLISTSNDGKLYVYSVFDSLVRKGFLREVSRIESNKGRFTQINYTIHAV